MRTERGQRALAEGPELWIAGGTNQSKAPVPRPHCGIRACVGAYLQSQRHALFLIQPGPPSSRQISFIEDTTVTYNPF